MAHGWTVEHDGTGEVRFLIGMRWSQLWRLAATPWVARSFLAMLRAERRTGLERSWLAVRPGGPAVVQRWRSRADLDRWARDRGEAHAGPWGRFAREEGATAAWGIWHEVR